MDKLSDSETEDISNNAKNENLDNQRKRRRLVTYNYENDAEFDNDFNFSGSENGNDAWQPSISEIDEFNSYLFSDAEPAEDLNNIEELNVASSSGSNIIASVIPGPQSSGKNAFSCKIKDITVSIIIDRIDSNYFFSSSHRPKSSAEYFFYGRKYSDSKHIKWRRS